MKDASTPSILSSITILFPASPNVFFTKKVSIADIASSLLLQTITPFPAASPSALITIFLHLQKFYTLQLEYHFVS